MRSASKLLVSIYGIVIALVVARSAVRAQSPAELLASGDTLAAVDLLAQLTAAETPDPEHLYLLGRILAERASERDADFYDRRDAENYLTAALQLKPDEPRYLASLALVYMKRRQTVDARRLLDRAIDRVMSDTAAPRDASPEIAAMLQMRARVIEWEAEDLEHLVAGFDLPVSTPGCSGTSQIFCVNFTWPSRFNEQLFRAADLSQTLPDLRREAVALYRAALKYDPQSLEAGRRLLGLLHEEQAWPEYLEASGALAEVVPDSGWSHLLLGTGLWRAGFADSAAAAFERGMSLLHPTERRQLEEPARVLSPDDVKAFYALPLSGRNAYREMYWARADPLHLTDANERRLEHLSRMVYADLRFGAPQLLLRGWDTDRGEVYVRYGPPQRIFHVRRDSGKEMSPMQTAAALQMSGCENTGSGTSGGQAGCAFMEAAISSGAGRSKFRGGRWIFWNYGKDQPNFIFERNLRSRAARHKPESISLELAQAAERHVPVVDAGPFAIRQLPVQVARFRGPTPREMDVLFATNASSASAGPISPVTGLFVFDSRYRNVASERHEGAPNLLYVTRVPAWESYEARIEYADVDAQMGARWLGSIDRMPAANGLMLSDILLAKTIEERVARPVTRAELAFLPNAATAVTSGEPLPILFEVYGLIPDADSIVSYAATVRIFDTTRRAAPVRLLRALGRQIGAVSEGPGPVTWRAERKQPYDRVVEYAVIDPGVLAAGAYTLEVTVGAAGQSASVKRDFLVISEDKK